KGFVIQGDGPWGFAGWSVSRAGDVNGDGYDDIIVSEPFGSDSTDPIGRAFVVYGKAGGFGTVDATGRSVVDLSNDGMDFTSDDGFVATGEPGVDKAAFQVTGGADVNGDGYDDLVVGAPLQGGGGDAAGTAYVIYGSSSAPGTIDSLGRAVVDVASLGPN